MKTTAKSLAVMATLLATGHAYAASDPARHTTGCPP